MIEVARRRSAFARLAGLQAARRNLVYTRKQGQYLAFIYNYTKINGRPPAEADMQRYFKTTPPTVHQMVLTLETKGFIEREAGDSES